MESRLVFQREKTLETAAGHIIRIKMKLWQLSEPYGTEFPQGYKFSWIAYNVKNPQREYVLIDNHKGKELHYHIDDQEEFFKWVSIDETEKLFLAKVQERFGYFDTSI